MFIISLSYKKELNEVDQHIQAHVEFLEKYYSKNKFIVSGRKTPRTGGIILANCSDIKEVEAIIAEDPFYKAQVAEYQIIEFTPTMASPNFKQFMEYT